MNTQSKLLDTQNTLANTKVDLEFLSNIINAFLDCNKPASPTELYGFSKLCKDILTQLNSCESELEKLRAKTST